MIRVRSGAYAKCFFSKYSGTPESGSGVSDDARDSMMFSGSRIALSYTFSHAPSSPVSPSTCPLTYQGVRTGQVC